MYKGAHPDQIRLFKISLEYLIYINELFLYIVNGKGKVYFQYMLQIFFKCVVG